MSFFHSIEDRLLKLENSQNEVVTEILSNLHGRLLTWIEEEVKSQLSEEGIRDIIRDIVKNTMTEGHLVSLTKEIAKDTLKKFNVHFVKQEKVTRTLCLSIDSEIKAVLTKANISYKTEADMAKRINAAIEKISSSIEAEKKIELLEGAKA